MPLPGAAPDETSYIDRLDAIRHASGVPVAIATAANVDALARVYPGMTPGLIAALGKSGVGPGPQADAIWQKQLASNIERGQPGEQRTPKAMRDDKHPQRYLNKEFYRTFPHDSAPGRKELSQFIADHSDAWNLLSHEGQKSWLNRMYAPPSHEHESGGILGGIKAVTGQLLGGTSSEQAGPHIPGVDALNRAVAATPATVAHEAGRTLDVYNNPPAIGPRGTLPTRDVVRAGMTAMQGGLEYTTGLVRSTLNDPLSPDIPGQAAEQTTAYQALDRGLSTGEGFLPSWESPAMQAQAEAARRYSPYLIGGHAWTPGRALADTVFEPDSDAFKIASGLVDAGVALSKLDPAANVLGTLSDVRKGTKTFATSQELAESGAVAGVRDMFSPKLFNDWQHSRQGSSVLDAIARESSEFAIHNATGLPYYTSEGEPLVAHLADATTPDEVAQALRPHVGLDIPNVPGYNRLTTARMNTAVPGMVLPVGPDANMNEAARIADNYLVNARVPVEDRKSVATLWARAGTSQSSRYGAVDATFGTVEKALVHAGLDADKAATMMTREKHLLTEITDYGQNALNEPLVNSFLSVGGDGKPVPHALWDNQFLNSDIALPDFRVVRRAVSGFAPLINNAPAESMTAVADAIMVPWRKLMLMRPAWGARVIAEEQVRLAAYGGSSITHHPLSFIGMVIGNPDSRWIDHIENWETLHTDAGHAQTAFQEARSSVSLDTLAHEGAPDLTALEDAASGAHRISRAARRAKNAVGRATMTPSGESFSSFPAYLESQYGNGITKPFSAVWDQNPKIYLHEFTNVDTVGEHGPRALAEELARIHESRLGRGITRAASPEEAKAAFWDGDLSHIRGYMAEDPTMAALATNRAAADAQIDLLYQRLSAVTADNPTLVDAIRTGHVNGTPLTDRWGRVTDEGEKAVADLVARGETVPGKIRARKFIVSAKAEQSAARARANQVVDYLFDAMMPRPSNYLSRSPFDREMTWKHAEDLFAELGPADRATMIQHADEANMGKSLIARLQSKHARLLELGDNITPRLSLEALNDLAIRRAGEETKNLLYDLSERSQFFDAARLIFPFGEAWKEVVGRWAKLAWENPQVIRRAQQTIMGARSPGSNAITTATGGTPLGKGFFFRNSYGEEVFAFPGSELLTNKLIGAPVPLTGSVQGLNMVGNGLPGLGPAVQLPLSYLLPDKPEWDGVTRLLYPYGKPDDNPFLGVADTFLPAYAKRLRTAFSSPNSSREYAGAVKDTANYLASTGDYDLQGPNARDEVNRLLTDAKAKAKGLYLIRAAGSFTLPASPSPEWLTTDKAGNLTAQWRVADWFYKQVDKVGYDEALKGYFNKFGTDNYLLLQPKSDSKGNAGLSRLTSVAGSKWLRAHPELQDKYPSTYGLFAPDSKDFDAAAYQRQFDNGEREALTPREMVGLANDRLASFVYDRTRANLPEPANAVEREAQASQLRDLRGELREQFPGYAPGKGASTDPINQINELYRAADDPAIRRTAAGRALRAYLVNRDKVLASQQAGGLVGEGVSTAQANAANRAWLNRQGEELLAKHPQFQPLWDILSREAE